MNSSTTTSFDDSGNTLGELTGEPGGYVDEPVKLSGELGVIEVSGSVVLGIEVLDATRCRFGRASSHPLGMTSERYA